MLLGKSAAVWVILALAAVAVFVVFSWLIPTLFMQIVGIDVPPAVGRAVAFLIALGVIWGGYSYGRTGGPA